MSVPVGAVPSPGPGAQADLADRIQQWRTELWLDVPDALLLLNCLVEDELRRTVGLPPSNQVQLRADGLEPVWDAWVRRHPVTEPVDRIELLLVCMLDLTRRWLAADPG